VTLAIAFWVTLGSILLLAIGPAAWVLGREALRRFLTRRAVQRVEQAQQVVRGAGQTDAIELARVLTERFDPLTVDRAVVELVRSDVASMREYGRLLFAQLGLERHYIERLRKAAKWSERTHAAEVLGLAAMSTAIPALVETLRDRHEDEGSVKLAAAAALARLRDPSAVALLVGQLSEAEEQSSRNVAEALVAFGEAAIAPLLELLADSGRPTGRLWAARILGRIGDPRAVDQLVARLEERDERLRMASAEALGTIGDPRALHPAVRAMLRDPAPQVRAHAAGAVARIEGERAIDVLVSALADPDYATRIRVLEAFETMRIEDTSQLESALRDPNAEVRRRAALALERVGYVERIVADLSAEDRATRKRAYTAFLELGHVGLVETVASYVHHASFEVRAIAARACGELGAARVAPVLLKAIADPAWPVRAAVCEALGRLPHPDAPKPLVEALGDTEEPVREAAAEALTSYSAADVADHLDALALAYDRGNAAIRKAIVTLVGRLDGPVAEGLIVRATVDPSDLVRLPAVTALGQRGQTAPVEPLVARLTDASLDVRMAAVTALGAVGRPEAFEGLLRALPGAPRSVRDRIAEALARIGSASLFKRVPDLERNASLDVRLGIAWTLGKLGDPGGVPTLARFLQATDAALRASAAGALAKIPHPSSLRALLGAAQDPDGRVRAAVVNGLGRIGGSDPSVVQALALRLRDPDAFVRNRSIIALARAGRAEVEARVVAEASRVETGPRLLALALVGTESAFAAVLQALTGSGVLQNVLAFLEPEEPVLRTAFFSALRLDDPFARGPVEVLPDLVAEYEKTLRTSLDVDARRLAVSALQQLGVERAISALADALAGDPNEAIRQRAAAALSLHVNDETARRALTSAIADPNSEIAMAAIRALHGRRETEVAAALRRRLGLGGAEVQDVVEEAIAALYQDDPTPFIDWMMGVEIPELLTPGVRVLGRIANPSTSPLLRELLRSRAAEVRAAATAVLGALHLPETDPAFDEAAQDPNEEVRIAVVGAIRWNANALTRMAKLRRDPSERVRVALAVALERIDRTASKTGMKALESMAGDASSAVRAAALASLIGHADPEGLRAFGRLHPLAAIDTRAALRDDRRARALSERAATILASSTDPAVRKIAVVALGALQVEGLARLVVPALSDPAADVRISAIQVLAGVTDEEVRSRISAMLLDPEAAVQETAKRVLARTSG